MAYSNKIILIGTLVFASSLSGCVTPTGPVDVTRFAKEDALVQQADGNYVGSFMFDDEANGGSLALSPYRAAVTREMQRLGFNLASATPAPPSGTGRSVIMDHADYVVSINVDRYDSERPKNSNVSVGGGASTGSYGSGVGLGLGINLSGRKKRTHTELSVRISQSNENVWEGRALQSAKTGSPAAQEGIAASKLASSLFLDFPGRSGETIEVE